MTIKKTLLTAFAILAIGNTGYAIAYDPRTQHDKQPSVEVNLDVLNKLSNSLPMPSPSAAAPEHDFLSEKPVKYEKPKSAASKHEHKKHKVAAHKHKKKVEVAAQKPKEQTAPEVRVTAGDQEEVPVLVHLPKDKTPAPAKQVPALPEPVKKNGNMSSTPAELPPLPSEPSSSKLPALPSLPSDMPPAKTQAAPAPAAPALPPLPEKKQEFIMAPTGQITPVNPPAQPAAPAAAPKPPALPPLPGADAVPALPELPAAKAGASSEMPALPPLPSASAGAAPAAADATPADATPAAAADNGPAPDLRIVFNEAETDIPMGMASKLDVVSAQLTKNPNMRVSIMAYASGSDAVSIYPKRVSLARGIAVRNYFVSSKGIDVERITVKALGNKNEGGPANRVDLFIIK